MAWEIDPDFALQSRITFGRTGMVACAAAAVAAVGAVLFGSRDESLSAFLLTPGLVLLFIALPYSALQVVSLDRDGRFDQRRLAGRPALALGAAVLTGSSWLFWLTGAVLIVAAAAVGGHVRIMDVAVLIALGTASALLLLVMPDDRASTWLLRAGVLIAALILAGLAQVDLPYRPVGRSFVPALFLVTSAGVATLFPFAMRRMHRPRAGFLAMPSNVLRPLIDMRRTRFPEFGRALLGAGSGAMASVTLAVLAAGVILVTAPSGGTPDTQPTWREAMAIGLLYGPMLLAAYNCSTATLREQQFGSLDRVRLAGQRPWRVVLEWGAGLSLPFLAISAPVAVMLAAVGGLHTATLLLPLPAAAMLLIGVGLAEGLRNRPLGLYLGPLLMALTFLARDFWFVLLLGFWIPWVCAASAIARPHSAGVSGVTAVLAAGHLAALATLLPAGATMPFLVIAGVMSLAVGLFVPTGRPGYDAVTRGACAVGAAFGAGATEMMVLLAPRRTYLVLTPWEFWLTARGRLELKLMFVVICALFAAAGLMFGWFAHNAFGSTPARSRLVRMVPFVTAFLLPSIYAIPFVHGMARSLGTRIDLVPTLVMEFLSLAIALLSVIVLMTLEWRRSGGAQYSAPRC